jgi:hypothetical protein
MGAKGPSSGLVDGRRLFHSLLSRVPPGLAAPWRGDSRASPRRHERTPNHQIPNRTSAAKKTSSHHRLSRLGFGSLFMAVF